VFSGHHYISTSDGTRIMQPYNYATIYAWVDALTLDGERIYDRDQWVVTDAGSFEAEALMDRILEMGESVAARVQAPVVQFYEGPVLFEGDAAADFLRYLVSRELMGTPSEPSGDRTYHQMARNGPRIGRRLLPAKWTVVDDPNAAGVGQYRFDMEGVPAQEVTLVDDGYVRDLLMSRVPRHDRAVSNGHARGAIQGSWSARLSNWRVIPHKNLSERAFYRHVDRVKNAAKTERILVVKGLSGGASLGALPRPTDAVWRHADGSETPVRTLMFQNVDRRTLRDIASAGGGSLTRSYLDPFSGRGRSAKASGLPMSVTGPRLILLAEMELVYPGPDEDPHLLPPPALSRGAASEDAPE